MILRIFLVFALILTGCSSSTCAISPRISAPTDEGFIKASDGKEIHQDENRMPILIVMYPDAEAWSDTMKEATEDWNMLLGFNAFTFVGVIDRPIEPSPGLVPVLIDENKQNRADTFFGVDKKTGFMQVAAIVMPVGKYTRRIALLFAMHELGHVLGLDHDPDLHNSLMHPKLEGNGEMTAVTQEDIQRLRRYYAKSVAEAEELRKVNTSSTSTAGVARSMQPAYMQCR